MTDAPKEGENPETATAAAPEAGSITTPEAHDHEHGEHDHQIFDANTQQSYDTRCMREITVEIPADVVNKQWDKTAQRWAKSAPVPGFRKGKVPASVIRNRYADDIKKEVFEALVPQYFREAVLKEGYRPITEPSLLDLEMEPGNPLRFKAAFEVLPDFELGTYDDIRFDKPDISVKDEDIDAGLKNLQERRANYDPVDEDRPLQDGDFAQISFKATPKEEQPAAEPTDQAQQPQGEGQPVQMDEVLLEIGAPDTVREFSENLRGAKPGEERNFDVAYAADYPEQRLAGKTITYSTKVNAIKKKAVPELNDDFARELNQEFESLDALKQRMREGMEAERQHQTSHELKEKLLDQLLARHDFPVPEVLVQHQIDSRLERGLRALAAQGMNPEDMKKMDFRRLRAAQRDAAIKEVKSNLLLEKIADDRKIEISEEELQQEIQLLAQQMKQTPEAVYKQYSEDGTLNEIRSRMRVARALNFLYNKSLGETENGTA